MSEEDPDYDNDMMSMSEEDPGSSAMISMVVVCSSALVIFGVIYYILWYRAKDKHEGFGATPQPSTTGSAEDARPPPPSKFTQKIEIKEYQPGDPIYDTLLIGGTVSLGVLMWIGATIVLIMSLVDQSEFQNAMPSDFSSLGPRGCRVEKSTSYTYYDQRLDALNTLCVEEWQYSVQVVVSLMEEEEETTFVSAPIMSENCRSKCDVCLRQGRLYGAEFYPGLDPTTRGTYITNQTFVECWEPTIPVEDLSDFYQCDKSSGTCFLLEDTSVRLEAERNSSQIGLISAYACYAGGALLLLVAGFFVLRNKQVREAAELGRDTKHVDVVLEEGDHHVAEQEDQQTKDDNETATNPGQMDQDRDTKDAMIEEGSGEAAFYRT
ncbi:expressed unknown protein [Seminavis robusta]|uniref:Transmembrane protein n=1 Tax=Seminavis robusta TaxID=568900 RepID=A0A9N8ETJ0_9STRA|nr:expressed unknown protein [Seminavis robusta]|eukprot:Sro1922_g305610.1 n/a (379) ;mRNA; f:13835-14971